MLCPEWSRFFIWSSVLLVSFPGFWWPIQVHQIQLVSLSPSCFTAFSAIWHDLSICLSLFFIYLFFFSFIFILWSAGTRKSIGWRDLFFLFCFFLLILGLVSWVGLADLFISQNLKECYGSHFLGQILTCAYTICQHSQVLVSCTIPTGSPFPQIFCTKLLHSLIVGLTVSLSYHISTCCLFAYYQFLEKRLGELEIRGRIKIIQTMKLIKSATILKKSCGLRNSWKLAVTQISVKNHQLKLIWKTSIK